MQIRGAASAVPPAKKRVAQQVSKANVVDVVGVPQNPRSSSLKAEDPLGAQSPEPRTLGHCLFSSFTCG